MTRSCRVLLVVGVLWWSSTAMPAAWADNCGSPADCFGVAGSFPTATVGLLALVAISLLLDFVPVVGTAKGVVEAATGRDLVTGQELSPWERALGVVPVIGGVAAVGAVSRIGRVASEAHTGARSASRGMDLFRRWERYAPDAYDSIRATDDVGDIARNTGWPEYRIQRIKDHLFHDSHRLDDGYRRFDADPDIADAWDRLRVGDYTPEDIRLLEHEYFEYRVERIFDVDYRTAHDATIRSGRTWDPPR